MAKRNPGHRCDLDSLFAMGALVGVLLVAFGVILIFPGPADDNAVVLVFLMPFLVGFVAFPVWNYGRQGVTGQTVGKRLMGISVLRVADGRPTGSWVAISRNLLVPALASLITGGLAQVMIYLWPLWDTKRQSLTDKNVFNARLPRSNSILSLRHLSCRGIGSKWGPIKPRSDAERDSGGKMVQACPEEPDYRPRAKQ